MISREYVNNTIKAENQVAFPYYFDGVKIEDANLKVMILGNSITYHELRPEVGWNKECGMAASNLESDYVHLVLAHLSKKKKTAICVFNGANWEMDYENFDKMDTIFQAANMFKPDIVIVRIGENCNGHYQKTKINPEPYFDKLLSGLKKETKLILTTSMFWKNDVLDLAMEKASKANECGYVLINDLGELDENKAIGLYDNPGICGHPNDNGMKKIAERINFWLDQLTI